MIHAAFLFPGQGSQSVGMLSELSERYSIITETFGHVSNRLGYDVWRLVQEGPEAQLNQTEHTQVAMLTADVAVFKLLQTLGLGSAQMMAGHSLGEYAALVCAEAIDLLDAAQLVAKRGQLMQATVPLGEGAMAAIVGLTDEQIEILCTQISNEKYQVNPANYNAIGQVVIAGHSVAVEHVVEQANELGARMAKMIPVSVPCHCPLLTEASEAFEEHLAAANFKSPLLPVISNVDLSIYKTAEQIRRLLKVQLCYPVRWVETIQLIKNNGIESIIECGPGKVLSGLVKRIDKTLATFNVNDSSSLENLMTVHSEQ